MTDPVVRVPWTRGDGLAPLLEREWLVTNGLGGYASGTLALVPTRRYHGLLVPNLPAPRGRTVVLAGLDEVVHAGSEAVRLGGVERPGGVVEGGAAAALREFALVWRVPTWVFDVGGARLERRVVMPHGQSTVLVVYRLDGGGPVRLELRPWLTFRMHDGPLAREAAGDVTMTIARGRVEVHAFEGAPVLRLALRPGEGVFVADERDSGDVLYREERARGYDHVESLTTTGSFSVALEPGATVGLVASVEPWDHLGLDGPAVVEAEQRRLERLLALAPEPAREGLAAHLVLAADQFVVLPGSRSEEDVLARAAGDEARTVIAGYHWFTDWGRDTMIGLEGLTLCTGRAREAGAILRTFSHYVADGLLPNLFPEGQRTALYHTADATLWYFHALDRYLAWTGDVDTLRLVYPVLVSIVDHHVQGTRFGIGVDPADGLLRAGAEGYQLTWMDAKVEGWVVTPRRGKPVEIQALWYNALRLMDAWAGVLDKPGPDCGALARRAFASFNARFWLPEAGHLADVVDGPGGDDPSLRPNQVFALSLRHPVLDERRWRPVLDTARRVLLTPFGLRTLAPGHPDYRPRYEGDLRARDAAYHQGLVWAWLVGHFVDAWRRVDPGADVAPALAAFEGHLAEAGVGSISEIFDAETPHLARGCIAQAWSVAEVLRAILVAREPGER
jgi:predicted glycogen debranching enzyme